MFFHHREWVGHEGVSCYDYTFQLLLCVFWLQTLQYCKQKHSRPGNDCQMSGATFVKKSLATSASGKRRLANVDQFVQIEVVMLRNSRSCPPSADTDELPQPCCNSFVDCSRKCHNVIAGSGIKECTARLTADIMRQPLVAYLVHPIKRWGDTPLYNFGMIYCHYVFAWLYVSIHLNWSRNACMYFQSDALT